jgi:hypothetical protein
MILPGSGLGPEYGGVYGHCLTLLTLKSCKVGAGKEELSLVQPVIIVSDVGQELSLAPWVPCRAPCLWDCGHISYLL